MILIVVMLLGSIALIVFALVYKAKKNTKKQRLRFEEHLARTAAQHHLSWTTTEISRPRALAWSADKKILFFMDFPDERGRHHVIDMNHVAHCRLSEEWSTAEFVKGKKAERHVTGLNLVLFMQDKNTIELPLYREAEDGVLERARLSDKAAFWLQLIQPELKNN
ncbi:MAG TPA: hypothetical protein VL092_13970 [Chitinophagaceae bacterium]|nr:hypothetical protein [Chitinophagaceae bacterium]